ncbi:zinc finger MYM-type protein 1-like [Hydra vulgaris]|uniref:Zinc finger MYM-type protein 1-like n=1 Tax=Hydra vulgaris TaxID=6087 RepID=A0ABM4CAE2_HYDVU
MHHSNDFSELRYSVDREQCLDFRGNSDVLHKKRIGNFLKLVELLAQSDAVMADHVHRIKNEEINTHYLVKNIQNELIQIIEKRIREEVLSKLQMAKYFSTIVDCTQDVSKVEQMSNVLRFVQMKNAEVKVCEHFIDFIPVEQTTGAALKDVILQILTQTGIPIEDMRGQGYDNGANMRGHQSGVQKRILEKNSRVFFVPCHAHSLNLVVNDAAKSSREVVAYFEMVQAIYNFLSGSSRRWTNIEIDISEAKQTLNKKVNFLKLYRSDEAFKKVISDAELIAAELDLEPSFLFEVSIRPSAINWIEERFNQLYENCDVFQFLYDFANIKKDFSKESHREKYELLALSELIEPKTSPLKVLEFILRNNNFTPNISIALRILLTQPVSVASAERSFSKLKLIKDYLRSIMSQNRLTGLSLISIESDMAKKLDFTELMKAFASEKSRRVNFFH